MDSANLENLLHTTYVCVCSIHTMHLFCIYFIVVDGKDLIACDANGTVLVLLLYSALSCMS